MSDNHSEITFERCPHDKQNPYVMISREMLQDPTISPKAKGLLAYLLSLPKDWKIYHSQLQKALNVGEDYINSAMEELIDNGYAERTREKIKGMFQAYKYKIREFKKCLPNGENQAGSSGPENPVIQNKHNPSDYTKETTTKEKPAAVAVSFNCLEKLEIPTDDKIWLCENYDEETIKHAIAFAEHPQTKITKGLAACIKWACKNKPKIPLSKTDEEIFNKTTAMAIRDKAKVPENVIFEVLNKNVEVGYPFGEKGLTVLNYTEKGFKEQLESLLRKYHIKF